MTTELMPIEVTAVQAPDVFVEGGLDVFYNKIREEVMSEIPDLSTKKGRDRVASLSAQVSRSKVAIEKPGREYLKHLKEAVKPAEREIKRFVDMCDELRDEVRKPLTEWEQEQKRIEAERIAAEEAEKLRLQVEADHEMALLMNAAYDREQEDKRIKAEQERVERDRKLQEEAAEKARIEEQKRQQAERDRVERQRLEAIQREEDAKRKAEEAEKELIAAQEKAKQDAIDAENRRIEEAKQAEIRAAKAAELAAEAERKRIADEQAAITAATAKREADIEHRRAINGVAKAALVEVGITPELAECVVKAIAKGSIPNVSVRY